jgi:hypothetical protein
VLGKSLHTIGETKSSLNPMWVTGCLFEALMLKVRLSFLLPLPAKQAFKKATFSRKFFVF